MAAGPLSHRACYTALRPNGHRAQLVRPLRGLGKDITEGYLDVAKLLSGSAKVKTSYEKLASMIGAPLRDALVNLVQAWAMPCMNVNWAQTLVTGVRY